MHNLNITPKLYSIQTREVIPVELSTFIPEALICNPSGFAFCTNFVEGDREQNDRIMVG
jgi:hypothetical protein